jgi:hypothetical protein
MPDHRAVPGAVRTVLAEAGLQDTAALELAFGALAAHQQPAPEPSPELAALLAGAVPFRSRTRIPIIAASVGAAMALGVGAVAAANPEVRQSVNDFVTTVTTVDKPAPTSEERQDLEGTSTGLAELPAQAAADGQNAAGAVEPPAGGGPAPDGSPGRDDEREERGEDYGRKIRTATEPKEAQPADLERKAGPWVGRQVPAWPASQSGAKSGGESSAGIDDGNRRSQAGEPYDDGSDQDDDDGSDQTGDDGSDQTGAKVPRQDDGDD